MSALSLPIPAHAIESDAVIDKLRRAVEADNNRITDESLKHMREKTREKMMKWKKFGIAEMQELFSIASESAAVMKKLEKETKIKNQLEQILEVEELALVEQRPEMKLKRYLEKIEREKKEKCQREAEKQEKIKGEEKNNLNGKEEANQTSKTEQLKGEDKVVKEEQHKKIEPQKQKKQTSNQNKSVAEKDGKDAFKDQNQSIAAGPQRTTLQQNAFQMPTPLKNQKAGKPNSLSDLIGAGANKKQTNNQFANSSNPFTTQNFPSSASGGSLNFLSGANKVLVGTNNFTTSSNTAETNKKNPFSIANTKEGPAFSNIWNTPNSNTPNPVEAKANQKSTPADSKAIFSSLNNSNSYFNLVTSPEKTTQTKKEPNFLENLTNKPNTMFNKPSTESTFSIFKPSDSSSLFKPPIPSASIFYQSPSK